MYGFFHSSPSYAARTQQMETISCQSVCHMVSSSWQNIGSFLHVAGSLFYYRLSLWSHNSGQLHWLETTSRRVSLICQSQTRNISRFEATGHCFLNCLEEGNCLGKPAMHCDHRASQICWVSDCKDQVMASELRRFFLQTANEGANSLIPEVVPSTRSYPLLLFTFSAFVMLRIMLLHTPVQIDRQKYTHRDIVP